MKEVESRINLGTVSFHKIYFVREMTAFIFDNYYWKLDFTNLSYCDFLSLSTMKRKAISRETET